MGGHHEQIPKVPDWKIYKVEDVPELMNLRKALAKHNLKDNWSRNHVWLYKEYQCNIRKNKVKSFLFRTFKYGFIGAVIGTALQVTYLNYLDDGHHNEAHHH